jgi:hypothetical protein
MLAIGIAMSFTIKSPRTVSAGSGNSIKQWVMPDFTSGASGHKLVLKSPGTAKAAGLKAIDYGSFSVVDADDALLAKAKGFGDVEIHDEYNVISLNAVEINTTSDAARELHARNVEGGGKRAATGKQLQLIQFSGPVRDEWMKEVTATGVQIVDYIPNNAYLVYGDSNSLNAMRTLGARGGIQWAASYESYLKVSKQVFELDKRGVTPDGYEIQLVNDKESNASTLGLIRDRQIGRPGVGYDYQHYVNVVANLDGEGLAEVAARPDVISIQPYFIPKKNDERQDMILAGNLTGGVPNPGNYLNILASWGFTQAQFNASNFIVDVTDDGADRNPTGADPGTIPQDANAGPVLARHFVLYETGARPLGAATPTGTSRFIYKGRWGTGSTTDGGLGVSGHGQLNMSIVGGYVPTGTADGVDFSTFPHADASGFRYGLGVAPFVKLANSVIFDPNFTSPNIPNMLSAGYASGTRISSNSWGAAAAGAYNANAQTYDGLVRDAQSGTAGNQQMIITFSAGNSGPNASTIGSPGTAKNLICVGATEGVQAFGAADGCGVTDAQADSANDVIGFSSRGPCTDGRVKPDIQAPGTHISGMTFVQLGTTGSGTAEATYRGDGVCAGPGTSIYFPTTQQWYTASSGTSHSNPAVAGGSALVYQQFINNPAYIATYRQPSGSAPPSPAMAKAYLMNSTRYLTGVSANDTLPSNSQGMGMMNLGTAFDGTQRIVRDQVAGDTFANTGETRTYTGTVADATKPFRVTLGWTDAPGSTTGNAFVNNLDLEVTIGGNTYRGNVFTGANSVTGGAADIRNNVESVFLPAGFAVGTPFTVRVLGTNIAGNGVPNDAGSDPTDQDFALVVYNGNTAVIPVVGPSGQAITSESCSPSNGVLDPAETVTVNLSLTNSGTAATNGNVIATLQTSGGVTAPGAAQDFGPLGINGSATRPFTFTVNPAQVCGSTVTATLALSDGGGSLGTVSYTFQVGTLSVSLAENFDGVTVPALPANWTAAVSAGGTAWVSQASTPDTAPNSVFAPDPNIVTDNILTSPIIYATGPGQVTFRNNYNTENTFDGGVLEISINEGPWQDIVTAGGSFTAGGYNGTLSTNVSFQNPLVGRAAWTGNSGGYITTTANLPAAATGNFFRLRWRLGTDNAVAGTGWRIDSVQVSAGFLCCGQSVAPAPAFLTRGTVTATEAAGPTNSDSDGSFEPCETLNLSIPLTNVGGTTATGASVTISTSTPNVTILQPTASYGAINAGATVPNATFAVKLDQAFVPFTTINFTATTTYSGGPVTQNVSTFSVATACALGAPSVTTVSNTTAITIPATVATGTQPATPYPAAVTVSGVTGSVTKVTATITNYTHAFPSDVDIILVGPGGQQCVLMSDIGGTMTGRTFTFDDAAAAALTTGAASGTYRPTNSSAADTFPAPGPGAVTQATPLLSVFNNVNPNGTWNLFVVDDFGSADSGSIAGGWTLNITTQTTSCSTTATCTVGGGCGTPANINSLVSFTGSGAIAAPTCGAQGYSNDYVLNGTITNTSSQTLCSLSLQLVELAEAGGAPPAVPFRLISADSASCTSGGLPGAVQTISSPATLAPGQSANVTIRVAMPTVRRFRLTFNVFGGTQSVVSTTAPAGKSRMATNAPLSFDIDNGKAVRTIRTTDLAGVRANQPAALRRK